MIIICMKTNLYLPHYKISREMERQRHLEWEKQRIQDLQAHLQKELDSVIGIRERSIALDTEYQTLVKIKNKVESSI